MVDQKAIVSSGRKLLYNIDHLLEARDGVPKPVMFHVCLTNRCQLACPFCCYRDRVGCEVMPIDRILKFVDDCDRLGTRTWELTGGGEPLLYPWLDELLDKLFQARFAVGLMTNGLGLERVKNPGAFRWIRVSLHALEQHEDRLREQIKLVRSCVKTTCYLS